MGDLPQALPRTVMAADHLRRHASRAGIQRQATDLLQAAARAEATVVSVARASVPPHVLRELIVIASALAGRRWLRANAASPAVETFITLRTAVQPPTLPALDQILSGLLWSRFSGPGAAGRSERRAGHPAAPGTPRSRARHRATA
jgi:hypothetical protein